MERPSFDRTDYSIRDLQFCFVTLRVKKKISEKGAFISFDIPGRIEISKRDFSRVEIFILMMDFVYSSSSKRNEHEWNFCKIFPWMIFLEKIFTFFFLHDIIRLMINVNKHVKTRKLHFEITRNRNY